MNVAHLQTTVSLPIGAASASLTELEVQPGLTISVVIDAQATDSISLDLAAGRFPATTRPAVEYLLGDYATRRACARSRNPCRHLYARGGRSRL